ncbi:MAG: polynucleotide adenylyltransferase, partial [Desulfovibrionaceae bacterium]|nr:polynucleotide adenylyltransferase [Desulfovibrionaceae bacterium]
MELYLAGGAVRDLLQGLTPRELDFAFAGSLEDFLAAHADARPVGKSVRVCLWHGQEYMPLRGNSIQDDLAARDITVNDLALDSRGVLHFHTQAIADLCNRVLRPASPTALADDPARAFRLARFAALWPDWTVSDEALAQMRGLKADTLARLPAERVGRELLKALKGPRPGRFFEVLTRGHALEPWF